MVVLWAVRLLGGEIELPTLSLSMMLIFFPNLMWSWALITRFCPLNFECRLAFVNVVL